MTREEFRVGGIDEVAGYLGGSIRHNPLMAGFETALIGSIGFEPARIKLIAG